MSSSLLESSSEKKPVSVESKLAVDEFKHHCAGKDIVLQPQPPQQEPTLTRSQADENWAVE